MTLVRPEAEFLLYQTEDGRTRVEVRFDGDTAWLSLGQMTELFQRDKSVISRHIKNVFEEGELDRASVVAESATTAADGKTYQVEMHWAAHGHTAAEVIVARADATKPNMGLTNWMGEVPRKADALVAKNYLAKNELEALNRIVTAYLEFAELQAMNHRAMYMADWISKLDDFLKLSDHKILQHAGRISHDEATARAEEEYERFSQQRAAFPFPVEKHFEEAIKDLKQIDRSRCSKPALPKPKRGKKS